MDHEPKKSFVNWANGSVGFRFLVKTANGMTMDVYPRQLVRGYAVLPGVKLDYRKPIASL